MRLNMQLKPIDDATVRQGHSEREAENGDWTAQKKCAADWLRIYLYSVCHLTTHRWLRSMQIPHDKRLHGSNDAIYANDVLGHRVACDGDFCDRRKIFFSFCSALSFILGAFGCNIKFNSSETIMMDATVAVFTVCIVFSNRISFGWLCVRARSIAICLAANRGATDANLSKRLNRDNFAETGDIDMRWPGKTHNKM